MLLHRAGADLEGDWGENLALKPIKVTLFTLILYNSENSIRDIRSFCRPLFCHSSVVEYASPLFYSSEAIMRLGKQILLKSTHLTLLTGSATAAK